MRDQYSINGQMHTGTALVCSIGYVIISGRPFSFTIARRRLHCCGLLAADDGGLMCQSMSEIESACQTYMSISIDNVGYSS